MRVLGIDIIDVSANFSVIIGLDDCFLCHIICYFISGDHSLVFFFLKSSSLRKYFLFCSSSVCFFFLFHTVHAAARIDLSFHLSMVTSICLFHKRLPATRKKSTIFVYYNLVSNRCLYCFIKTTSNPWLRKMCIQVQHKELIIKPKLWKYVPLFRIITRMIYRL